MSTVVSDLWEDFGWFGALLAGTIALLVFLVLPVAVWMAVLGERDWERFKIDHHCQVVGKMSGSVVTTVGPTFGGQGGIAVGVGSTPDRTGWLCDDGVTYWR